MFGDRFFGPRYFGNRYFGVAAEGDTLPGRRHQYGRRRKGYASHWL